MDRKFSPDHGPETNGQLTNEELASRIQILLTEIQALNDSEEESTHRRQWKLMGKAQQLALDQMNGERELVVIVPEGAVVATADSNLTREDVTYFPAKWFYRLENGNLEFTHPDNYEYRLTLNGQPWALEVRDKTPVIQQLPNAEVQEVAERIRDQFLHDNH